MVTSVVLTVYLAAFFVAAGLLYWRGAMAWPYHVLCLAVAIAISLVAPPESWAGPTADLVQGAAVFFFIAFGAGGLVFHPHPHHLHLHRHA